MIFNYVFYQKDESFDFGDFNGGTYNATTDHGFEIDIDNNKVDITTLSPYNDYSEMEGIKSLEELASYLNSHLNEVQAVNFGTQKENLECFKELLSFIEEN